ncbi:MAG: EamA family transporter [Shinella sp.]|nr:EamA family transporter [Shinella sp.]
MRKTAVTTRTSDILLTALAPAIWGSTYITTTQLLPAGYPMTVSLLRALPAGLLLLLLVRELPKGIWWARTFLLGALNFSFFWAMLFVSAYRLPGGVAATVGAVQPLIVILLSRIFIGSPIRALSIVAGIAGMGGVGLLVLTPSATLDPVGVAAGLAGAVSMAFGTVLSRHWQPPVSPLTFTAWQLTAGGILLVPVALLLEPPLPSLTGANILGFAYLGLVGAAFTYILWFRGLSRLEPSAVSPLGFLSPLTAVILGWGLLGQDLTVPQIAGMLVVLGSVWLSQRTQMGVPIPPVGPASVSVPPLSSAPR